MKITSKSHSVVFLFILMVQFVYPHPGEEDQVLQRIGILDSIYSEVLNEQRQFYIQLPPSYNADQKRSFPVVYVLDGEVLLPTVHNVQSFYSGGFTPEMVLVGISNSKNRTRDLTISKIKEKYGMPFNEESGGAPNFMSFLKSELIPYIEGNYPVTTFRTLIGHSYGGLFTIYSFLDHPDVFSNYIAIDPSLDWNDQELLKRAADQLSANNYTTKSLFISLSGQLHMQDPGITIDNVMQDSSSFTLFPRSNIAFSEMIREHKSNGLAFEWKFYPRDLHGTIPFPSIMDGLIFDFKWFQMENTDKFNSPETPANKLSEIINYRVEKLKTYFGYDVPPYPEDLLNMLGYMSMDMGQADKAKMFLEYAIQFYPDSPNTYDSMADYYERQEDYENALKFVAKAYELSGSDYHKGRLDRLKKKIKTD